MTESKPRPRQYRLPSGDITDDVERYGKEWSKFADQVVEFFPGYRVSGMDPGVLLFEVDGTDSISLSTKACKALLWGKELNGMG